MSIITIEPVEDEVPSQVPNDAAKRIANTFGNYEYKQAYSSGEVTRDLVRKIAPNQVIIWRGHGVPSFGNNELRGLVLGEHFPKNVDDALQEDVTHGLISQTNGNHMIITQKFIAERCGRMDNSLIFLLACHSSEGKLLPQAFIDKGASAVVGFNKSVEMRYGTSIQETTLERMTKINWVTGDYYTLREALDYAKITLGGTDKEWTARQALIYALLHNPIMSAFFQTGFFNTDGAYPEVFGDYRFGSAINQPIVHYNGSTYKLIREPAFWETAKAACENLGGHLVTINSSEEQAAVEKLLEEHGKRGSAYWIGITDSSNEGVWDKWITGENITYAHWSFGEPNNDYVGGQNYGAIMTGDNDYAGILSFGYWDDISNIQLDIVDGYICEWGPDAPDEQQQGDSGLIYGDEDDGSTAEPETIFDDETGLEIMPPAEPEVIYGDEDDGSTAEPEIIFDDETGLEIELEPVAPEAPSDDGLLEPAA